MQLTTTGKAALYPLGLRNPTRGTAVTSLEKAIVQAHPVTTSPNTGIGPNVTAHPTFAASLSRSCLDIVVVPACPALSLVNTGVTGVHILAVSLTELLKLANPTRRDVDVLLWQHKQFAPGFRMGCFSNASEMGVAENASLGIGEEDQSCDDESGGCHGELHFLGLLWRLLLAFLDMLIFDL